MSETKLKIGISFSNKGLKVSQHAVTYPRNRSADFEDVRSVCWPTNKPNADLPVLAVWWPTYL